MTKPTLAALTIALIMQLAGCVIEVDHRDRDTSDVAAISARWSFRNMADGAVTSCPTGFTTAQLYVQPVDDSGTPTGDLVVDLFDCSAGAGTSAGLTPGVYQVWLEARSDDLAALYAQSLSQTLDVRRADQLFTTTILNDGGYFQLAWDLVGKSSNRPVSCAQVVGLDAIVITSSGVGAAAPSYTDRATCEDHALVTAGLLHGSYSVAIDAIAASRSIGRAPPLASQPILDRNGVTDLGHLVIQLDGL